MRWRRRPPGADRPVGELALLAVDLETTGLDPQRHEVLSIGTVPVDGLSVLVGGARQYAVRPADPAGVGQSATVHGITDDAAAGALPLAEVLPEVLADLQGRVLLAHHAVIEVGFLRAAAQRTGLAIPELTVVDTMRLQRRVLRWARWRGDVSAGELNLGAARRHHGLPAYRAHDALTDALACAELYLAQVAALAGGRDLTLGDLLR